MAVTQIREWLSRISADSDQRSRTSSASQNADVVEKVRTLIKEDCHLTIWEVADEVGISRGSAKMILTEDVGMQRVAAKFFPVMSVHPRLVICDHSLQEVRIPVAHSSMFCTTSRRSCCHSGKSSLEKILPPLYACQNPQLKLCLWNLC